MLNEDQIAREVVLDQRGRATSRRAYAYELTAAALRPARSEVMRSR